jgi:hypothetical protein
MKGLHAPALKADLCSVLTFGVIVTTQADSEFNTTISGFGTIGGTYTGDSAYTYYHNGSEFKATNSQFDLGLDSRVGVQADFTYGTDLSVIVQEEAKRRGSDNFSPGTEWAFLQYAPTSDVKLRLGRVALATFLMSDSRDVGYAQPWFNAPNDIYGSEPFETLDGGQAFWHVSMGPVGLQLQGAYGTTNQTEQTGSITVVTSAKSAYNLAASLTYEDFVLRVAETAVSFPLTLQLGPTTAVSYSNHDKFRSAGFQYDNGKAILLSEWGKRTENDAPLVNLTVSTSNAWYVAGGWRFQKFTPLLILGKWDPSLSLATPAESSTTWSASLRYDIVRNLALKAQLARPQVSNISYFTTADFLSRERVNVISVGADFVF